MDRVLSSGATLLYKIILPLAVLALIGAFAVDLYLHYDTIVFNGKRGAAGPHGWYWALAVWIAAAAFFWVVFAPLKKVSVEGDHLVVSNFLRKWRVPFSSVANVRMVPSTRPCPIIIEMKENLGFGKSAKFLAKGSTQRYSAAPYGQLAALRELVGLDAPTPK
jgi:hypothetical protein